MCDQMNETYDIMGKPLNFLWDITTEVGVKYCPTNEKHSMYISDNIFFLLLWEISEEISKHSMLFNN